MADLARKPRSVRLDAEEEAALDRLSARLAVAGERPNLSETLRAAGLVLVRYLLGEGPVFVHVRQEARWRGRLQELIEARAAGASPEPGFDDPRQQRLSLGALPPAGPPIDSALRVAAEVLAMPPEPAEVLAMPPRAPPKGKRKGKRAPGRRSA